MTTGDPDSGGPWVLVAVPAMGAAVDLNGRITIDGIYQRLVYPAGQTRGGPSSI